MIKEKTKNLKTILVIEDERPLVHAIQTKLEANGFIVVTARTFDQGLDYLENVEKIDAIWLDHYLPGDKTGLDFVADLKKPESKWNKLPIFIVSNTASSGNVRSYMHLGVSRYCVKAEHRLDQIVKDLTEFLDNPE
jgi:DNA-binding response OmpR family regulator